MVDTQPIAVSNPGDLIRREPRLAKRRLDAPDITSLGEPVRPRGFARFRGRAGTVIDAAGPTSHAHPVIVRLFEIVAAIGADTDMIDAGDLHRTSDQFAPGLHRAAIIIAGNVAIGGTTDHAAIVAQGANHV